MKLKRTLPPSLRAPLLTDPIAVVGTINASIWRVQRWSVAFRFIDVSRHFRYFDVLDPVLFFFSGVWTSILSYLLRVLGYVAFQVVRLYHKGLFSFFEGNVGFILLYSSFSVIFVIFVWFLIYASLLSWVWIIVESQMSKSLEIVPSDWNTNIKKFFYYFYLVYLKRIVSFEYCLSLVPPGGEI